MRETAARAPVAPMPLPPARVIGRDAELALARQMLESGDVRELTLTGVGGVGKTTLALAIAGEVQKSFPDGVFFADLSPLTDPDRVLATIALAVGLRPPGNVPVADALRVYLHNLTALLLIDNLEHVLEAAPGVAGLLASCPRLVVVATSRERLRLRWEHLLHVEPLPLPGVSQVEPHSMSEVPSVALFVERARAVDHAMTLTESNARPIAEICARLDGLPLAIELAAAQMSVLSAEQIAARLSGRFDSPQTTVRDAPSRHETMRAVMAWSYALLSPQEQAFLRSLAAFAGGWTIEAAQAVASTPADLDVLTSLASLTEKSLVVVNKQPDGSSRFRLLETVRQFALDELTANAELDAVRRRHVGFFLELGERAASEGMGPAWYNRLEPELENIRLVLKWSQEAHDNDALVGLRLATALLFFFWQRGHAGEGRDWLASALERNPEADVALCIRAYEALGTLAGWAGDYSAGDSALERSRQLAEQEGDDVAKVRLVGRWGWIAWINGRFDRIAELQAAADAMNDDVDGWTLAHAWLGFGHVLFDGGPRESAIAAFEKSIQLFTVSTGENHGIAHALTKLAVLRRSEGDDAFVRSLAQEGIAFARKLSDPHVTAFAADDVALLIGENADAMGLARLLAATDGLRERLAWGRTPTEQLHYMQNYAALAQKLETKALDQARAEGRALTIDQVPELASELLDGASVKRARTSAAAAPIAGLSEREREVLRLLADGLSNREIADSLVLSVRTVEKHIANVYAKIGARGRADAAAFAVRNGVSLPA